MMSQEEALVNGRKLYAEIFESTFSTDVLELINSTSTSLDDILFALFNDSVYEGYITDITDLLVIPDRNDGAPLYALTSIRLRTMMCAALTIGIWYQRTTNNLDNIWKGDVDKNL